MQTFVIPSPEEVIYTDPIYDLARTMAELGLLKSSDAIVLEVAEDEIATALANILTKAERDFSVIPPARPNPVFNAFVLVGQPPAADTAEGGPLIPEDVATEVQKVMDAWREPQPAEAQQEAEVLERLDEVTASPEPRRCEICGDPLPANARASTKICKKQACFQERNRRYAQTHKSKTAQKANIETTGAMPTAAPDEQAGGNTSGQPESGPTDDDLREVQEFEQQIISAPVDDLLVAYQRDLPAENAAENLDLRDDQEIDVPVTAQAALRKATTGESPDPAQSYLVMSGVNQGKWLTTYQVETKLKFNEFQPGTLLRHKMQGLKRVVQGQKQQKLVRVIQPNGQPA